MERNCFNCKKSVGCPLTWMCFSNPSDFDESVCNFGFEPYDKLNFEDDEK